jgi:nicotinamide-nucleotide amidase
MGRRMAPQNLRQASIPTGATVIEPVGTAPGFALTLTEPAPVRVYALPGVSWELQELFVRDVEPEVAALAGPRATMTRVVHVIGMGESDVAQVVEPIVEGREEVELSFLARQQEIQVRLTISATDAAVAREQAQPLVEEVVGALGGAVAGIDDEQLEDVVLRLLGARDETVATAESATAGDIAARLGRVPGASHGLRGGIAVYATEIKRDVLGVDPDLLDEHGPVSAEVTSELARLARERFGADWGVGVTGCAGPEPQNGQPVGTAFWALAHPDGHVEVHGRRIPGDRAAVIARLGSAALDLLRRRLLET